MKATTCLGRALTRRHLALDTELRAELNAICASPATGAGVLWERLARGCAVIDARGGEAAPDALWRRWEALFAAWWCCEDELAGNRQRGEARRRREYARALMPLANWSLDDEQTDKEPST